MINTAEITTSQTLTHTQHPAYKDSGVDWLGEIPAHWELTKLGARFFERREKVSDKDYAPLSVTKQGVVPQLDNAAKTNDGDNRKLVKAGDFVINSRSDRKGSSGISSLDGSVSLINIVLEPKNVNPLYCNYLLKSYNFIEEFYRNGHGIVADLWTTRYSEMKAIMIGIPPLPEQTRIAEFLDRKTAQIDQAIAQKERLIELLNERRQVMIQKAVTRGINPNVPMKNSGIDWIGEIPAHWKVSKLKYITEVQSGITLGKVYSEEYSVSVPYLRVANVQDGYLNLEDVAEITVPKHIISNFLLRENDILVTEGGDIDKLGRGAVWYDQIKPCIHQNHVFAIRTTSKNILPQFIALLLGCDYGKRYFTTTANKTTNLASTNKTKLGNFPVLVMPLREQEEIHNAVSSIFNLVDGSINRIQKQIKRLQELKATLINSAVTGKIKV